MSSLVANWKPSVNNIHNLDTCLKERNDSFMKCIHTNDIDTANEVLKSCITDASNVMQSNKNASKI